MLLSGPQARPRGETLLPRRARHGPVNVEELQCLQVRDTPMRKGGFPLQYNRVL
jgi:hypothetical protein